MSTESITCPKGYSEINGKCIRDINPPPGSEGQPPVVILTPECPEGYSWDEESQTCILDENEV